MIKTDKNLVSVIVPVYNGVNSIERCLNSLLNQSIPVEIIVIDDGSTDGTSDVCEMYSELYPNIRYFRQNNGGVSSARNAGMRKATGKYIGFVDSDDYVSPLMYEMLTKPLEDDESLSISIVCVKASSNSEKNEIKTHRDIIRDILCSSNVRGYTWNKLFRKSIIDDSKITFSPNIHVMEDKLFCLQYMNSQTGGGIELNENLYFYDLHKGSHTLDRYGMERYKTGLNACEEILRIPCIFCDEELTDIQQAITVKHCIQIARESIRLNEDITMYRKRIARLGKLVLFSRHLTIKQKAGYFVLKLCPCLLKWI